MRELGSEAWSFENAQALVLSSGANALLQHGSEPGSAVLARLLSQSDNFLVVRVAVDYYRPSLDKCLADAFLRCPVQP